MATNQTNNDKHGLRRTASEVKKHRVLVKICSAAVAALTVFTAIMYVAATMYGKSGYFTIAVKKFDSAKYALTLSEDIGFLDSTMRLNVNGVEDITNITEEDLPKDLDSFGGPYTGDNFFAYTFFVKNAGSETVDCEYELFAADMTNSIDKAIRVRLYKNSVPTNYARVGSDGNPEQQLTDIPVENFLGERIVTKGLLENVAPGAINKFTIVIWLEGEDPDCIDDVLGGQYKLDMSISIVGVDA